MRRIEFNNMEYADLWVRCISEEEYDENGHIAIDMEIDACRPVTMILDWREAERVGVELIKATRVHAEKGKWDTTRPWAVKSLVMEADDD